jgi:integrase
MTGVIKSNVFDQVKMIKTKRGGCKARGCHDINSLNGVFDTPWEDRLSYLLCLLIYTTGMRNSEIERIQVKDITDIDGCHFIDVKQSKTENGLRIIPLHDFVYRKISEYIKETGIGSEDYIFSKGGKHNQSTVYRKANRDMGLKLGIREEDLREQGISFYSGRHYWKTVMNAEGLGEDSEEIFMGHKVSNNIRKRYNHRDKQGKEKVLEVARGIFRILDKRLFNS